jgi:hypothetical protein
MLYNKENSHLINTNDRKEVLKVCYFLFITII